MRRTAWLMIWAAITAAASTTTATAADDLVAIRPGVLCVSAAALASLTLPDGDSRTHVPSPRPQDLATARRGGCSDVVLGHLVRVRTAHHNSSVVTGPGSSDPLVVANIDFQPLSDPLPPARDGLVRTQHVVVSAADGSALDVLEDARITPDLRRMMWGVAEDPGFVLDQHDQRLAGFKARPLRPARLLLVDAQGGVLQVRQLTELQAIVWPAPLHGLPAPGFMLTVDDSIGMGSYAGRVTTLLLPSLHGLDPETAASADGARTPIELGDTLKTGWTIVPSAGGATEIELVACRPTGGAPDFVTTYSTYRLAGDGWRVASRRLDGIWDDDTFPSRAAFP